MRWSFVAIAEEESCSTNDGDQSSSDMDELVSTESDKEDCFPYGEKALALTKEEILSLYIHDLKLSYRLSRVASTEVTSLLESFIGDDSSCWNCRTTKK
jgi:hypothetical protein